VIYLSDLFTHDVKYSQTLSWEKWRSFAKCRRSILKPRSTLHEVAWQFNNLAYSSGLMFVWPGHFYSAMLANNSSTVHPRVLRFLSWLCSCALPQHSVTRKKNFSTRARPAPARIAVRVNPPRAGLYLLDW